LVDVVEDDNDNGARDGIEIGKDVVVAPGGQIKRKPQGGFGEKKKKKARKNL
jgi:hypothetical protein